MRITVLRAALGALLLLPFSALPAAAGNSLFPPDNSIVDGAGVHKCPPNHLLYWTGNSVECKDPLAGLTTSCGAGQVVGNISNGVATCTVIPTNCGTDQVRVGATCVNKSTLGGDIPSAIGACPATWQIKVWNGSAWSCVDPPRGTLVGKFAFAGGGGCTSGGTVAPAKCVGSTAICEAGWTMYTQGGFSTCMKN